MSAFDPYRELLKMADGPRPPSARELLGLEPGESSKQAVHHALARRMEHVRRYANSPSAEVAEAVAQLLNEIAAAAVSLLTEPAVGSSKIDRREERAIAPSEESLDEAQIEEVLADFLLSRNPEEAQAAHRILDGIAARRRKPVGAPPTQIAAEARPSAVPDAASTGPRWLHAWRPVGLGVACLMAAGLWSSTGWLLAPPAAPPPASVHVEFSPPTCREGEPIRAKVSLRGGTETGPRPATVEWGDGDRSSIDLPVLEHIYADNGTYTVTIFDEHGAPYPQTAVVRVQNADPLLHGMMDYTVDQGDKIQLELAFSDPGARDTHTAKVDWGGQVVLNGEIMVPSRSQNSPSAVQGTLRGAYIYRDPGRHPVTVTITDKDGGRSSGTLFVNVRRREFQVSAVVRKKGVDETPAAPLQVQEGDEISLEATFNSMGIGRTYAAKIDWGDGTRVDGDVAGPSRPSENGSVSGSHSYGDEGEYRIVVTVTDDSGRYTTESKTVTVRNAAPSLRTIENREVYAGEAFSIQSQFSDPGVRDTHTVEIDWGDGTRSVEPVGASESPPSKTVAARHTYRQAGSYQVTVKAADNGGGRGECTFLVEVIQEASPRGVARAAAGPRWHVIVMTWPDRTYFATVLYGDKNEAQEMIEEQRQSAGPCRSQKLIIRDSQVEAREELSKHQSGLQKLGFQQKSMPGSFGDFFDVYR